MNHHGQSILFGCGLISNEDAHTFKWLKYMNDQLPNVIITNQDKAMQIVMLSVLIMYINQLLND